MINPENTVRQINDALKVKTDRDISIVWDGDLGESISYYVCADGDDTNFYVWEDASGFQIAEDTGRSYVYSDAARSYDGVAAKLIEAVS